MDFTQDSAPKPTKHMGRPPCQVTEEKKKKVAELGKLGLPHDQIAFSLRISVKTLRKHFRSELYDSAIDSNCKVLSKLFELASTGNPAAASFWARTRCKFRPGGSVFDEEISQSKPPAPESKFSGIEVANNDGEPNGEW